MSLPAPYWLQPQPNRGTAATFDGLPPKFDFIIPSAEDIDQMVECLISVNPDVYEPTDDTDWELSLWRADGSGALVSLLTVGETPTANGSALVVSDGQVRLILLAADRLAWPGDVYYVLGYTDSVPRVRLRLAWMMQFPDRLATEARCR